MATAFQARDRASRGPHQRRNFALREARIESGGNQVLYEFLEDGIVVEFPPSFFGAKDVERPSKVRGGWWHVDSRWSARCFLPCSQ